MTVRIEDLRSQAAKSGMVDFRAGQTVRVHRKIREGDKERIQIFEGLILKTGGTGAGVTITVRKIVGGIGVEQVFPVSSPLVEKIELIKEAKVRQGRIYYVRGLRGKAARFKERFFTEEELKAMQPHELSEAEVEEAVKYEKEEESKKETEEASAASSEE